MQIFGQRKSRNLADVKGEKLWENAACSGKSGDVNGTQRVGETGPGPITKALCAMNNPSFTLKQEETNEDF